MPKKDQQWMCAFVHHMHWYRWSLCCECCACIHTSYVAYERTNMKYPNGMCCIQQCNSQIYTEASYRVFCSIWGMKKTMHGRMKTKESLGFWSRNEMSILKPRRNTEHATKHVCMRGSIRWMSALFSCFHIYSYTESKRQTVWQILTQYTRVYVYIIILC